MVGVWGGGGRSANIVNKDQNSRFINIIVAVRAAVLFSTLKVPLPSSKRFTLDKRVSFASEKGLIARKD